MPTCELVNDAWLLDVRLDLALADAARQAFEEGVPLVLELEIEGEPWIAGSCPTRPSSR